LIRTTTFGAITDALAISGTFDRAKYTLAALIKASVTSASYVLKELAAYTGAGLPDLPRAVVPKLDR
jgi:hypothetical protein